MASATATLNVKVPEKLEKELDRFMEENPGYMSRSEAVRDAIRHLLKEQAEEPRLSDEVLEDIAVSNKQFEEGKTVSHEELRERLRA